MSEVAVGVAALVHKPKEGQARPHHHTCLALGSVHHNPVGRSTGEAPVVAEGASAGVAFAEAAFAVEASAAEVSLLAARMPVDRPRPSNPGRRVHSHPTQYQMETDLWLVAAAQPEEGICPTVDERVAAEEVAAGLGHSESTFGVGVVGAAVVVAVAAEHRDLGLEFGAYQYPHIPP